MDCLATSKSPGRNVNRFADDLVASYCKGCGLLIAASPARKILDVMENFHECPVYFHYQLTPESEIGVAWPVRIDGQIVSWYTCAKGVLAGHSERQNVRTELSVLMPIRRFFCLRSYPYQSTPQTCIAVGKEPEVLLNAIAQAA